MVAFVLLQVQLLVESNRNIDLRQALELAAAVQPIEVDVRTINDVRLHPIRLLVCRIAAVALLGSVEIKEKFTSPIWSCMLEN